MTATLTAPLDITVREALDADGIAVVTVPASATEVVTSAVEVARCGRTVLIDWTIGSRGWTATITLRPEGDTGHDCPACGQAITVATDEGDPYTECGGIGEGGCDAWINGDADAEAAHARALGLL